MQTCSVRSKCTDPQACTAPRKASTATTSFLCGPSCKADLLQSLWCHALIVCRHGDGLVPFRAHHRLHQMRISVLQQQCKDCPSAPESQAMCAPQPCLAMRHVQGTEALHKQPQNSMNTCSAQLPAALAQGMICLNGTSMKYAVAPHSSSPHRTTGCPLCSKVHTAPSAVSKCKLSLCIVAAARCMPL